MLPSRAPGWVLGEVEVVISDYREHSRLLNLERVMKKFVFAALIVLGGFAVTHQASAAACANGVYRAGCVGPNGAAVVRKHPYNYYHHGYYHSGVNCAAGPYRAGCAGPHGAAVVRRPY
jgi:hypothetical protein